MKRSLKFLTLSFLILLAQSSLAASHVEGPGSVGHSEEVVAVGISYFYEENGVLKEIKNEAGNPKPEEAIKKYYATAVGIANKAIYFQSSAIGFKNTADGFGSSAFGYENTANGFESSAIGIKNKASGVSSSAFGYSNKASGEESSAIGYFNTASELGSSAFGYDNKASGQWSSAFGNFNKASGMGSSAFGKENEAMGSWSFTFGYKNKVSGLGSSAFGYLNIVKGNASFAIGNATYVSGIGSGVFGRGDIKSGNYVYKIEGKNSWAIGSFNSIAAGSDNNHILGNNVSIGNASTAITDVVVLGNESTVEESQVVSIGSATKKRKIVHLAAGTKDTDAVNLGQLKLKAEKDGSNLSESDITNWKTKLGVGAVDLAPINTKITAIEKATSADIDVAAWKTKLGVGSGGVDLTSINTNIDIRAKKDASNLSETDKTKWKTALGITGGGTVDAYTKTESDAKYLDKGTYTADKATFATKTELGEKVDKDASNLSAADITAWKEKLSVASVSGIANTATGADSTSLGHGNEVTGNKSTAVGYKNNVSGNNSGAFGDPNTVSGNRSYAFGNDNTIAGDDNFVMGSNVNIGAGITNSVALGNNSAVSSSNEVSVGSATLKRKITNVADGEVSATSTDAVTGKQLYNVMQSSGTVGVENLRTEVNEKIAGVKSEINHVGSLSAALSALHPMQYDPQAPNQIMAGFGHYRNKQSVAVGMSHYFSDNVLMTAGVAIGSERRVKAMANVGLTWKIGKGGSSSATNAPQYIVQDEMNRLTKENNQLKSLVNSQNDKLQKQDDRIRALEEKLEMFLKKK